MIREKLVPTNQHSQDNTTDTAAQPSRPQAIEERVKSILSMASNSETVEMRNQYYHLAGMLITSLPDSEIRLFNETQAVPADHRLAIISGFAHQMARNKFLNGRLMAYAPLELQDQITEFIRTQVGALQDSFAAGAILPQANDLTPGI